MLLVSAGAGLAISSTHHVIAAPCQHLALLEQVGGAIRVRDLDDLKEHLRRLQISRPV